MRLQEYSGRCDIKWFKHDADASSDAKIRKLLIRYGAVGYAVYFHCLELIAGNVSNNNITFELEHDSEIIADNLRIRGTNEKSGIDIVEEIMRYLVELGLFESHDGHITCFKMIKRLDSSMTSNSKFRKLILEAKEHHDLLDESHDFEGKSHDGVMINGPKVMGSADTIMIFDPKVMGSADTIMQEQNRIEQNRIEQKRIEDKNVTKDKKHCSDTEAIRLASLLLERSRVYDPKIAIGRDKQTINTWAKDIELLIRLDKRTPQEVEDVIMWCKSNGNFWIPNILSGKKLREKFPTLFSQMQTRGSKGQRTLNRYGTEPGGLGVKDYMGGDDDEE